MLLYIKNDTNNFIEKKFIDFDMYGDSNLIE